MSAPVLGILQPYPNAVLLAHPNGSVQPFIATANTNAARGTALRAAIAAATSGDTLNVGTGTFALGSTTTLAVPAGVHLRGSGNCYGASCGTILSGSLLNTTGTIVSLGDGCVVSDLFIQGQDPPFNASTYDKCIGFNMTAGEAAPTTATLINVGAKTMGIAFSCRNSTGNFPAVTLNLYRCWLYGRDDCINVFSSDTSSAWPVVLNTFQCQLYVVTDSQNPRTIVNIDSYTNRARGGIFNDYGSFIYAEAGPSGVSQDALGVSAKAQDALINLYGSTVVVANASSGNTYSASANSSGSIITLSNCSYDRSKKNESGGGVVAEASIPASDPAVTNAIYNTAGTAMISAG